MNHPEPPESPYFAKDENGEWSFRMPTTETEFWWIPLDDADPRCRSIIAAMAVWAFENTRDCAKLTMLTTDNCQIYAETQRALTMAYNQIAAWREWGRAGGGAENADEK